MPRKYKEARKLNHLKAIQAAEMLGVSQPTLSSWEGEQKSPSIHGLERMADLYGVTTDYLLGREEVAPDPLVPVSIQTLPILHGKPVWSADHGWMLVNALDKLLLLADGTAIPYSDAGELFLTPPPFCEASYPCNSPLSKTEVMQCQQIWLEPISTDQDLRNELRGWYRMKGQWAENNCGNRFSLDTYEAKWLAFIPEDK